MNRITDYEKETIILFNEEENVAYVDTFDKSLIKRFKEYSKKYPDCCRSENKDDFGMQSFVIDKSRLSIRLLPPVTAEQKEKAILRGKQYGFKKG